jgi:cell division protein FtsI (penicillin-binding protein 3)
MSNIRRNKSGQFGDNRRQRKAPAVPIRNVRQKSLIQPRAVDLNQANTRLAGIWMVLGLATLGLAFRLLWLQIIDGSNLQQKAQLQQSVTVRPFAPRRTIVDRSNNQIAIDRPSYTIYAHPKLFSEVLFGKGLSKNGKRLPIQPAEMARRLAPILDCDPQQLAIEFQRRKTGILLGAGIQEEIGNQIKALKLDGIEIKQEKLDYQRFYPQEDMLAEVLGYLNWERKAQTGVERSQSLLLERKVTEYPLTRTARGEILPDRVTPDFLHTDDLKLRLSVDLRLQRAARQSLRQKLREWNAIRGTAIVMDADTGALRALVVEPTYNPNQYGRDVQSYSKIVGKDRAATLLHNWAVSDLYEPGSTFKPIAVAIALENGVIKPTTTFYDGGNITVGTDVIKNADKKGNGNIDIAQILQRSSNVGMVKIMQRLKPDVYYDWLQRISLGHKSGIDLPLEERGEIRSRREFVASPIYPANTAFGQGFSLTPIQLVTLIGSLANGGKLVTPHVVEGLFDSAGVRKDKPIHSEPSQIFSPTNAQAVLEMMETVVNEGSGIKAKIPGYRIAGKTGTSQKAGKGGYGKDDNKKITSFVGILPVDGKHRYVVFAAIDEPKGKEKAFGSNVAAPLVKSVMESLISIEGIPPSTMIPTSSKDPSAPSSEVDRKTAKPPKG